MCHIYIHREREKWVFVSKFIFKRLFFGNQRGEKKSISGNLCESIYVIEVEFNRR